jgi:hypothetical protein
MINKIVELIINLEEFEFDDLGVEIMSLVDKPAIEVGWMAFNEDEMEFRENADCPDGWEHEMPDGTWMCGKTMYSTDEEFQADLLKVAREVGDTIDPEEIIYVDGTKENFATVGDFLQGARAIAALGDIPQDTPARLMYRYAGPSGQRFFCQALKGLNKIYTREDITRMNRLNPGFGAGGSNSYSVFEYKGGPNCQHYWEELVQFQDGTRNVLVSNGPATGSAGESNNRRDPSPDGAVSNNAYLMSKNWSFSDDDQMIITGPAMIPNALIPRKDEMGNIFHVYFSKETVEKVARKFLADNNAHVTDINHDDNIVQENTLLESWIVEDPAMDKSKAMGFNVPKATWMVSYKINNKDTWNKIKAGELNGFSVAGSFLEKIQSNG